MIDKFALRGCCKWNISICVQEYHAMKPNNVTKKKTLNVTHKSVKHKVLKPVNLRCLNHAHSIFLDNSFGSHSMKALHIVYKSSVLLL